MTDKQESKYKMCLEVDKFFVENFKFDADKSILEQHYNKFHSENEDLGKNVEIQETDITGYAERKQAHKKELAQIDYEYSSALRSYANDTDNTPLYNEFKLAVSKISILSDLKIVEYSNSLLSQLGTHQKVVEPYGVSEADIKNLSQKTSAYSDLLLEPQAHKDKITVATQNIKGLMQSIDQILERSLDLDMEQYKMSEPQLYDAYQKARQIHDAQTTHLSIIGTVEDADSDCDGAEDCSLQHVKGTVKFRAGKEWKEMYCTSTEKGNYQFKGIPDGKCTLTFTLEYYDTVVVESVVYSDKATTLDIKLKKTSKIDL